MDKARVYAFAVLIVMVILAGLTISALAKDPSTEPFTVPDIQPATVDTANLGFCQKYEYDLGQAELQFVDFREFAAWLKSNGYTAVNYNEVSWRDLGNRFSREHPPLHRADVSGNLCEVYDLETVTSSIRIDEPFLLFQDKACYMTPWFPLDNWRITVFDHNGLDDSLMARQVRFDQEDIDYYISRFHTNPHVDPLDPDARY